VSWSDRYIGVAWRAGGRHDDGGSGLDCWGLLRAVYAAELQLKLPSFDGVDALDGGAVAQRMAGHMAPWREVAQPKPFDGVLLRKGRDLCHVGVMVRPNLFLHVDEGAPAHLAAINGNEWRRRIAGYYRHAGVQ
jgi:probable lipoprotein NlpC